MKSKKVELRSLIIGDLFLMIKTESFAPPYYLDKQPGVVLKKTNKGILSYITSLTAGGTICELWEDRMCLKLLT